MLDFKKIFASILFFSTPPALADNISLPSETTTTWAFDVLALYLQPSFGGSGLGYSAYSNYAGPDNTGVIITNNSQNVINNIVPKWGMGVELDGFYYYDTSNDINLTWYHLNGFVNGNLPPNSLFSGSAAGFYAGNLRISTRWDVVNIAVGKCIRFDEKRSLHFHGGMEFAWIKSKFSNHPKNFPNSNEYFTSRDTLSYAGLGPRLGADFIYALGGLNFYLKTAGSVLWGTSKQNVIGYRDYLALSYGTANYSFCYRNIIVPELDAKLGLTYICELANGNFGIDLGYLWMNYFGAINSYTGIGLVGSSIGIPAETNFNLNGLYLGFSWKGTF